MINTVIANSVGSSDCALLGGAFSANTNNLIEDGNDDWTATCDIGSCELGGDFLFRNGFKAGGDQGLAEIAPGKL